MQNEPVDIEFFPFQKLSGEIENDIAVSRRVRNLMQHQDRVHIVEEDHSPADLVARMAECDLIVGMRLHAIIFGMIANVPVIALSYDPKVDQLIQCVELRHLCIELKSIENAHLTRLMREALQNAAELRATIGKQKAVLEQEARRNASIAMDVLRNEPEPRQPLGIEVSLLLRHGIQAQLQTIDAGRVEAARLLKEVGFYIEESQRNAARLEELSALLTKKEAAFGKTANEQNIEIAKLRIRISQFEKESRKVEKAYAVKLWQAEQVRRKVAGGLRDYQEVFQRNLISHRNERAWKIMLALRKAYTLLFHRGLGQFCKWVLSWPGQGPGSLAEYDVQFPNLSHYMPERLEEALLTEEASARAEAEEDEVQETEPAPVAITWPPEKQLASIWYSSTRGPSFLQGGWSAWSAIAGATPPSALSPRLPSSPKAIMKTFWRCKPLHWIWQRISSSRLRTSPRPRWTASWSPEPHGIKWLGSRVSGLSPPTTPSFIDLEIFRRPNSFGSAR